jgi:DNA-directed RNA polymerase sigma subunit (sigma70/sigma32)
VALKEFLAALWECSGKKQEALLAKKQDALLARLGWDGSGPIALEEAGHIAGISRERLRQLQNCSEARLPSA